MYLIIDNDQVGNMNMTYDIVHIVIKVMLDFSMPVETIASSHIVFTHPEQLN